MAFTSTAVKFHLHRYLAEFEFRYNRRSKLGIKDTERVKDAIRGAEGKRAHVSGN
jgi:hypothetical protein